MSYEWIDPNAAYGAADREQHYKKYIKELEKENALLCDDLKHTDLKLQKAEERIKELLGEGK